MKLKKSIKMCIVYYHLQNIGMGAGNNYGLSNVDTDYGFILNPDVILQDKVLMVLQCY